MRTSGTHYARKFARRCEPGCHLRRIGTFRKSSYTFLLCYRVLVSIHCSTIPAVCPSRTGTLGACGSSNMRSTLFPRAINACRIDAVCYNSIVSPGIYSSPCVVAISMAVVEHGCDRKLTRRLYYQSQSAGQGSIYPGPCARAEALV